MRPICLDSSGWIEITHAGPNAKKFSKALSSAEETIVSTITLYEIARYTTRVAGEQAASKLIAFMRQHTVAPVSAEIATQAATLGGKHKLAMADALIYATALAHQTTLWTQDDDFKGLPQVRYYPKSVSPK
jgi:toxin FitB